MRFLNTNLQRLRDCGKQVEIDLNIFDSVPDKAGPLPPVMNEGQYLMWLKGLPLEDIGALEHEPRVRTFDDNI